MNKNAYVLIGIPGSGKSTFANKLAENNADICIVSSDEIRKELFGSKDIQEDSQKVFSIFNHQIKDALNQGLTLICDATHVNLKNLKRTLEAIKENNSDIKITGIAFDMPLSLCLEQNSKRDRKVPDDVIERKYQSFTANKLKYPRFFDDFIVINQRNRDNILIFDFIERE